MPRAFDQGAGDCGHDVKTPCRVRERHPQREPDLNKRVYGTNGLGPIRIALVFKPSANQPSIGGSSSALAAPYPSRLQCSRA
jgi:hypothetical protein